MIAIFIFYDIASGAQAFLSFSKEFRHCNTIVFDGSDWLAAEFDRSSGIILKRVRVKDSGRFLQKLSLIKEVTAVVSVSITARRKVWWKPWWVRSCNEVSRYLTGVDTGFTFNPSDLYHKLIKYNARRNYQILTHWRRQDGDNIGRYDAASSPRTG